MSETSGNPRPAEGEGWVRALAPAKINPRLEVLGRRADGYHELDTLMLCVGLRDGIWVRAREEPGLHLEVFGEQASADIPVDGGNLAWGAAAAVLAAADGAAPRGLELRLEKNIPSGAGLGGGSSDAAAALLAAEAALGLELDPAWRRARLAELGSDCVFFAEAAATGHARCTGRGERIEVLPAIDPGWRIALLAPSLQCPTGRVYGALGFPLSPGETAPRLQIDLFEKTEAELRRGLFNRLERAALEAVPDLLRYRELLDESGCAHFALSGSGSAFFGLFRREAGARTALDSLLAGAEERGLALRGAWCLVPERAGATLCAAR